MDAAHAGGDQPPTGRRCQATREERRYRNGKEGTYTSEITFGGDAK